MEYKIWFTGYGSECVAAELPENIRKYIQEECDWDIDEYSKRLDNDEVPEEFKLFERKSDYYEVDDKFFNIYSPYSTDSYFTVEDEDGKTILEEEDVSEFANSREDEGKTAPTGVPYLVWESVEKGGWSATIKTDKPFDKSKLKLIFTQLRYDNEDSYLEFVSGVEYDGEEYCIEVESTTGKAYELHFYDDIDLIFAGDFED